ncbi:MAG: DUF4249 domain-containing protein [Chitinophagaceae bacterium]|nr:MAG: DUF4249 domain-containing protein [Chitinophagaceae bacterium]
MIMKRFLSFWLLAVLFTACKKDITIDLKQNEPMLVVEAYVNNLMPEYNYVMLSKSMDYYSPDFEQISVSDATVAVTEGEPGPGGNIVWNKASKVSLVETQDARLPEGYRHGVYVDQKTVATFSTTPIGLVAEPGKYYLLEISWEGKYYSAITQLPGLVPIDSLSTGFSFKDEENGGIAKARVTCNYKDPDTTGNRQLYYWRQDKNRDIFGWGAMSGNRRTNGTDDLANGNYMQVTQPFGFVDGEVVDYYLVSCTRQVYTFWDSFNKARNNDGPFSTPVELISNINGENVTGCFSGFTVSAKSITVKL